MLCSQLSGASGVGGFFVAPSLVPQREFDSVPQPELVVDDPKVVLDDMLGSSDAFCNFPILKSLGDEGDDKLLSFAGYTGSIALASEHSCLRYKRVASFTRLIPLLIPNRKNRRLKCAFTVRLAILS